MANQGKFWLLSCSFTLERLLSESLMMLYTLYLEMYQVRPTVLFATCARGIFENFTVTLAPAPYPSTCVLQYASWTLARYSVIPQIVLQGVMCLLVISQCLRQSLQLYKATKRWQLNKYFKLLVNQGLLYFVMWVFAFSITTSSNIDEN